MRVAIKHGSAPACCGTFTYGEVEDYTIVISGGNTREIMEETATEETMPIVSFKLYPNPVSDQLVVEQIDENNMPVENIATDIQLIDENGRVAFKTVFTDAKEVIEVSNYISGIYIVQMRPKSTFSTQKIIISH